MIARKDKNKVRSARHQRLRNKVHGTAQRPRLNVYRSISHIYVQVIDDDRGVTLAAASTLEKEIRDQAAGKAKKEAARMVGELAAKRAMQKGVSQVVFDRGGYLYTGRVAELAQGARDAGLKF